MSEKEGVVRQREVEIDQLQQIVAGLKRSSADTAKQQQLGMTQVRQEAQVQRAQCELLRHQLNEHQVQVKSLQELIVTREQDHVRERENLVPLNGELFNKRVSELVENEKEKHLLMNKNLISSAKDWQQKHYDLEKEFRIALYMVGSFAKLLLPHINVANIVYFIKRDIN